jgi:hypothetical protein
MRFSPHYRNALFASGDGRMIGSAVPHSPLVGVDVSERPQFVEMKNSVSQDHWSAESLWDNPYASKKQLMIFACGIRSIEDDGQPPLGCLYLEYDWETKVAEILEAELRSAGSEIRRATIRILGGDCRIVASTLPREFGRVYPLPMEGRRSGVVAQDGKVLAFATAYEGASADPLNLICVIEHPQEDCPTLS